MFERHTVAAAGHDQHAGSIELIAELGGRAGVPRPGRNTANLGQDGITAVGDLAELRDRLGEVTFSAACRMAVPWRPL